MEDLFKIVGSRPPDSSYFSNSTNANTSKIRRSSKIQRKIQEKKIEQEIYSEKPKESQNYHHHQTYYSRKKLSTSRNNFNDMFENRDHFDSVEHARQHLNYLSSKGYKKLENI